jgi:tetratricopeptide (TPR) repeat protein
MVQAQGEHLQAVDMFRKSLDTLTDLGARQDVGRVLAEMSRSVFALGNDVEAERIWREALRIAAEIRGIPVVLEALVGIASLRAKRGETQSALELLLMVLNHPACDQETKNRANALQAGLEAQLTPIEIEAIQAHAGEKTFEAVVEDLLR